MRLQQDLDFNFRILHLCICPKVRNLITVRFLAYLTTFGLCVTAELGPQALQSSAYLGLSSSQKKEKTASSEEDGKEYLGRLWREFHAATGESQQLQPQPGV